MLAAVRRSGIDVPDYYFYDFNVKVNRSLSNSDTVVLSAYWGRDRLDFALDPDAETYFNIVWGNRAVSGRWKRVFSPTLFGRFTAFFSEYESDIGLSFFETPITFGNKVSDLTFWSRHRLFCQRQSHR